MSAPDAAPRRTAAQMDLDVATGEPSPGAGTYQADRHSSGLTPANMPMTKGGDTSQVPDANTYNQMRAKANTGVTPTGFPDTKVSK